MSKIKIWVSSKTQLINLKLSTLQPSVLRCQSLPFLYLKVVLIGRNPSGQLAILKLNLYADIRMVPSANLNPVQFPWHRVHSSQHYGQSIMACDAIGFSSTCPKILFPLISKISYKRVTINETKIEILPRPKKQRFVVIYISFAK